MKIGIKHIATVAVGLGLVYIILSNKKEPVQYTFSFNDSKFRNRMSEFFFDEDLQKAYSKYDEMTRMGMNPRDAYKILGCE